MSSEMETRSREGGALATALAAEQALQAEESMLLQRAADLEKQVREHKLRKEAAALAKQQAEEQRKAEEELEKWAQELKAEVDKTIERLDAQRAARASGREVHARRAARVPRAARRRPRRLYRAQGLAI